VVYDNAGTGDYPVNPDVLYQEAQSCVIHDVTTDQWTMNITAAISKDVLQGGAMPQVTVVKKTVLQGNFIPRLEPHTIQMTRANKETAEYVCYTASTTLSIHGLDPMIDVGSGTGQTKREKKVVPLIELHRAIIYTTEMS
jgi:hypothetical protein